jgi:hypothetical protein
LNAVTHGASRSPGGPHNDWATATVNWLRNQS